MFTHPDYIEEFHENLDALLEDIILLYALSVCNRNDFSPFLRKLPAETYQRTHQTLLEYLAQHSVELYDITQYIREAQGA